MVKYTIDAVAHAWEAFHPDLDFPERLANSAPPLAPPPPESPEGSSEPGVPDPEPRRPRLKFVRSRWSAEQLALLDARYPEASRRGLVRELALDLAHPVRAVYEKARARGLHRAGARGYFRRHAIAPESFEGLTA